MKKILLIIATLSIAMMSDAQTLGFLQIPEESSVFGRAGTGIAVSGISSISSNMADAALRPEKFSISTNGMIWQPKMQKDYLFGAAGTYQVTDRLAVGAAFKGFIYPGYQATGADGRTMETYRPNEMAISAGAAYKIVDCFSAGVVVNYVNSSLAKDAKGSAFSADVSLKFRQDGLQAGLGVENLGTKVNYGTSSAKLPMTARLGVGYTISGFTAAAEADYVVSGGLMAGIGLEYALMDIVYIRAGYHYGKATGVIPSYVSLGLGVQFSGFHLDVHYLTASKILGNSFGIGLGYSL